MVAAPTPVGVGRLPDSLDWGELPGQGETGGIGGRNHPAAAGGDGVDRRRRTNVRSRREDTRRRLGASNGYPRQIPSRATLSALEWASIAGPARVFRGPPESTPNRPRRRLAAVGVRVCWGAALGPGRRGPWRAPEPAGSRAMTPLPGAPDGAFRGWSRRPGDGAVRSGRGLHPRAALAGLGRRVRGRKGGSAGSFLPTGVCCLPSRSPHRRSPRQVERRPIMSERGCPPWAAPLAWDPGWGPLYFTSSS